MTKSLAPIYLCVALISLILSAWLNWHDAVINPDGICYLLSAEAYPTQGIKGMMNVCGQAHLPFYSLMIYFTAKITTLTYAHAVMLLDAFFTTFLVLLFMQVVRLLGGNRLTVCLAALLILTNVDLNGLRTEVIRDHGYWVCYFLSLIITIQYVRTPRLALGLAWSLVWFSAALFRIEAVIFLILTPFVLWWRQGWSFKTRALAFAKLMIFSVAAFYLIHIVLSGQHALAAVGANNRLLEVQAQMTHGYLQVLQQFEMAAEHLKNFVLNPLANDEARTLMGLLLLSWFIYGLLSKLGLVGAGLLIYARLKRLCPASYAEQAVLVMYILVNIFITSIFLVENIFIAKRYMMALVLTLLVFAAFGFAHLWQKQAKPILAAVCTAWLLLLLAYSLTHMGTTKLYLRDSGDWLAVNAPKEARIYSNDLMILYYSKHLDHTIFDLAPVYTDQRYPLSEKIAQFDYLAIRQRVRDPKWELPIVPGLTFNVVEHTQNKRGDEVTVYVVKHQE